MTSTRLDDISRQADLFYEAAYDDRRWAEAIGALKSSLNATMAGFGFFAQDGSSSIIIGDCDEPYERSAFVPEMANPFLPALARGPSGDVIVDQSLMPRADFERSVFFNDWLAPQGGGSILVAQVGRVVKLSAFLSINRDRRRQVFDQADVGLMERFIPAFTHAVMLRMRVGALRLSDEATSYDKLDVGVIVLDHDARLLHVNDSAVRIFEDPASGLRSLGGRLALDHRPESDALRRLVFRATAGGGAMPASGGSMTVRAPETGQPVLALTVTPLRDGSSYGLPVAHAAILFVQRLRAGAPRGFEDRMQAMFGLTVKEAALAAALVAGYSVQQAADLRQVSIHTARTQLGHLFRNTGTTQQSQLVALLLGILPLGH